MPKAQYYRASPEPSRPHRSGQNGSPTNNPATTQGYHNSAAHLAPVSGASIRSPQTSGGSSSPASGSSASSATQPPDAPRSYREEFLPCPPFRSISGPQSKHTQPLVLFDPVSTHFTNLLNCQATPMEHCIAGHGLRDPDTRLFGTLVSQGKSRITLALIWPGYAAINWLVDIPIFGQTGLITRRELACLVALQFREFVWRCDNTPLIPTDERWRVGSQGYTLQRMHLSALWNVEDDIWQASIRILTQN